MTHKEEITILAYIIEIEYQLEQGSFGNTQAKYLLKRLKQIVKKEIPGDFDDIN